VLQAREKQLKESESTLAELSAENGSYRELVKRYE
jgi:hypothetical protein